MSKTAKGVLQFIVLLCIGVLLIWLSFRQVAPEKDNIIAAFRGADYSWIGVSMLIALMSHFLRAYRWNYLLNPLGHKVNVVNAVCHVIVGYFANYGIPRMGEVTRCSLAAKYDKVPFEIGFGTVITERIIDFLIFFVIFFFTLFVQFNELSGLGNDLIFSPLSSKMSGMDKQPVKLGILIAGFVALFVFLLMFRRKLAGKLKGRFGSILKGMAEGIGSVRKMEKPFSFIALSLLIWASYFYSLYACFFALPSTSHLGQAECLVLLLFGTFGVILSPGGLGAYPAIVGGILLYTYNIDKVGSFALPWLSWTSQFILVTVLGILCLIALPIINRRRNVVSQTA